MKAIAVAVVVGMVAFASAGPAGARAVNAYMFIVMH
jgi:hypothetical protein